MMLVKLCKRCLAQGVRTNSFAQCDIYSFQLGLLTP